MIWKRILASICLCPFLFGCRLGPEPARPANVASRAGSFVNAPRTQGDEAPHVGQWWKRFGDGVIDELVETALQNNADLRVAAAHVLEARALYCSASGQRWPQASANLSRDRRKNSFSLPQIGRVGVLSTTFDLGFSVSWQADLFGKLAREQQAAWAGLLEAEVQQEALIHTVIAEVVRLRVHIATLQRQLAIARANTASWQETFKIIERRYQRGVASALDLRLAKENLVASRSAEPELEYQLQGKMQALDVMLNRQPGTGQNLPDTLSKLPPLETPPVGLPVSLLDRRPDLRATELQAAAATARVGAALADLFPDLSLSGTGGWRADEFHDLIRPDTKVYNLLVGLAWKIFAGGALRAQVDAAEARAEAAAAAYGAAVLNALREVEDALVRDRTARRRYAELEIRLEEVLAAERMARERYQRGVEVLITVLEVERRRRNAQDALVFTQRVLWEARINLFLALGGEWLAGDKQNENSKGLHPWGEGEGSFVDLE